MGEGDEAKLMLSYKHNKMLKSIHPSYFFVPLPPQSKTYNMTHKAKSGIYEILNLENNKRYIGQSVNITSRWSQHRSSLRKGIHGNTYLQSSWNKYGEQAFVFRILELIDPNNKSLLNEREDYWMDYYESLKVGGGYNFQSAIQGTFNAEWHIQERERKQKRMSEKNFEHYSKLKTLDGIEDSIKTNIIERTLKFKDTHSIFLDRKSNNKLKIILTSKETGLVKDVYLFLNPYRIVTKEEFEVQLFTSLGNIFQIKPDSSEIIKTFTSPKEIRDTYPQVSVNALERILYGKEGQRSTKGLIFVPEKEYDPNELYTIRKKTTNVLHIDQDKNILKRYASVKHLLIEHDLNESSLRTILCKGLPTLQYPFAYEDKLESVKFRVNTSNAPKVKLIVINGDTETEYPSINDFISKHPEFKRKAIEKVLYEGKKHYKGLKFKTVKHVL